MSTTEAERTRLEAAARAKHKPRRSRAKTETAPPPRFDPDTGLPLQAPLDLLLQALQPLDKRNGLTGDHAIVGAYKLGGQGATYGVILHDGTEIDLGSADRILNAPKKVKAAIADQIGVAITLPRADEWDVVFERLDDAATPRDVTLDRREETAEWISVFLANNKITKDQTTRRRDLTDPDALAAVVGEPDEPFIAQDDRLYLRLAALVRCVTLDIGVRTAQHDASERLGALGFRRARQLSARVEVKDGVSQPLKARLWASPPGFNPDDDPTSTPLTLTDQMNYTVGTWGRGDKPTETTDSTTEQRGHVGTLDHQPPHPPSVKAEHRAKST